jgi:RhtB (resistance to homoserine/threonine) family protein
MLHDWIFLAVAFTALLAAMSPGPDYILVTRSALFHSRKAGIYTALGITAGLAVHVSYALIGFTAVIKESPTLYGIIQYLGAAYLTYLGIRLLLEAKTAQDPTKTPIPKQKKTSPFVAGFFCNLLNPKASLFILSLYTQVIGTTSTLWTEVIIALEILLVTLGWFILLTFLYTHRAIREKCIRAQKPLTFIMGFILIGFGIKVAFF